MQAPSSVLAGMEFVALSVAGMLFVVVLAAVACWAYLRLVDGMEGAIKELRYQNRDLVKACMTLVDKRSAEDLASRMEQTDRADRTGTDQPARQAKPRARGPRVAIPS